MFNATSTNEINPLKRCFGYGGHLEEQKNALKEFYSTVTCIKKVKGKFSMLPTQRGIRQSIMALQLMYTDLQERYGVQYIKTQHLSSDVVELFFSKVKQGLGPNLLPTPIQCKRRTNLILLSGTKDILCSDGVVINTEAVKEICAMPEPKATTIEPYKSDAESSLTASETQDDFDALLKECGIAIEKSVQERRCDISSEQGLRYFAGYLAHKLNDDKLCLQNEVHNKDTKSANMYICQKSFGGLKIPTDSWLSDVKKMETLFTQYFSDVSSFYKPNVIERVTNYVIAKMPHLTRQVVLRFTKPRTHFKIKVLNHQHSASKKTMRATRKVLEHCKNTKE